MEQGEQTDGDGGLAAVVRGEVVLGPRPSPPPPPPYDPTQLLQWLVRLYDIGEALLTCGPALRSGRPAGAETAP